MYINKIYTQNIILHFLEDGSCSNFVVHVTYAQQNCAGHILICGVERSNIHLHHCQSLSGCQSYVGCWELDSWSQDGGLGLSASDRRAAAASSWSAAGSAGGNSLDRSTKCGRRVENEESRNDLA